jgi:hypothetical protein
MKKGAVGREGWDIARLSGGVPRPPLSSSGPWRKESWMVDSY